MRTTRGGTRRKIEENLARHAAIMNKLQNAGMERDRASKEALRIMKEKDTGGSHAIIEAHKAAGRMANKQLLEKYGKANFDIGTIEQIYWLKCYDAAFRARKTANHIQDH